MKSLLLVLVLVAAFVVGLGFYLGWFSFSVDSEKFQEDKEKAKEKMKEIFPRGEKKTAAPTDKNKDKEESPRP